MPLVVTDGHYASCNVESRFGTRRLHTVLSSGNNVMILTGPLGEATSMIGFNIRPDLGYPTSYRDPYQTIVADRRHVPTENVVCCSSGEQFP